MAQRILIVDDVAANLKLLGDILTYSGYAVTTAASGEEALERLTADRPDLLLLDVMMPGMSGFDVCRTVRAGEQTGFLPIILITALDSSERVKGLEAGADDFLTKPVDRPELLARVRSLLRIKTLYDEVQRQRGELEKWNSTLEKRVAAGIADLERLSRLKRFFSPQIADVILSGAMEDPLRSHRSEITVVFVDLRGYTAFTESADPDDVMQLMREYHAAMGRLILAYEGTVERFAGDSIMIFFNDPLPVDDAGAKAVRMALDMQHAFAALVRSWKGRGYDLSIGIGIAQGYATLGTIGFEGRFDYGAIGTVCNVAARLCAHARGGQTLVAEGVLERVDGAAIDVVRVGELALKGIQRPVVAYDVMSTEISRASARVADHGG